MIEGLKPYPKYRESGVPWIGKIPSGWKVVRNGNLFGQRNQTDFGHLPILEVSLRTGVRVRDFSGAARKQVMSDFSKYKRAARGDLAYNMMRLWQGAVGVAPVDGLVSPAYVVAIPYSETFAEFYSFLLRTQKYRDQVDSYSRGIVKDRNRLYWVDFKRIPSVFPPFDDQTAIVRFLYHAGGRIEAYIRAKRKLVSLLNERKQAVIQRVVTRGLDYIDQSKPSGIPELGDIPDRWEIAPLKGVCTIQSGVTLGKNYLAEVLKEFPYLRVANVQAGRLNLTVVKRLRLPKREASRSILKDGDVLMTEGGDFDKLGRACLWTNQIENCVHQNHVFAVRPNKSRLTSEYLVAMLGTRYAQSYFIRTAKQTTNLASTNKTTLGRFKVLLPNVAEQRRILSGLDAELRPIEEAVQRAEQEIMLIGEYRDRLITDVVTGQFDVRKAARDLPDEAEVPACEFDADDIAEDAELDFDVVVGGNDV
jgi:type I restriction enzyme S subunit